jgi:hypothetical protein
MGWIERRKWVLETKNLCISQKMMEEAEAGKPRNAQKRN